MTTKVICVFNDLEKFNDIVNNNEHIANCEIFPYDNRDSNISIPTRYNSFIEEYLGDGASARVLMDRNEDDFWCAFVHQDFGFMENIDVVMEGLDRNFIYGPIGAKVFRGLFFGKKDIDRTSGFKTTLSLNFGQVLQGRDYNHLELYGINVPIPLVVDSLDCSCIIIHSSLIKKYNLRFDENLSFHMYAEELCYRIKKDYGIKSKVIPIKCFHLGQGNLDEDYRKSVEYLKEKFMISNIPSTCPT